MPKDVGVDYYEVLQISPSAEPETVHRVYRLLAQRLHPDNRDTGNADRFRALIEAYHVIGDPERRARYDVEYEQLRQDRWRIVSEGVDLHNNFQRERLLRTTVLEVLYTQRRVEPEHPGIFIGDLERLTSCPREHLEFTVWFLTQKKFVQRADNSTLVITVDGVEYLEEHLHENMQKRLVA
jgi:curved DNA-binding protein CbpA